MPRIPLWIQPSSEKFVFTKELNSLIVVFFVKDGHCDNVSVSMSCQYQCRVRLNHQAHFPSEVEIKKKWKRGKK